MSIVLPQESDLAVREIDQPVVGDGDAMGIAGQLLQNMLRPTKGPLGINNPVVRV
jgi:hypothetical protein